MVNDVVPPPVFGINLRASDTSVRPARKCEGGAGLTALRRPGGDEFSPHHLDHFDLVAGLCLRVVDQILPHLHPRLADSQAEGIHTTWRRTTLLVLAITLHNLPEGLAIGVAFGAAAAPLGVASGATLAAAVTLTIGIALQNFPEGVAVAMPLRREGVSVWKCFHYGQLSAAKLRLGMSVMVDPAAARVGLSISGSSVEFVGRTEAVEGRR